MLDRISYETISDKISYKDRYGLKYEYLVIDGFKVSYGMEGVLKPKKVLLIYMNDKDLDWLKLVMYRGANTANGKGWSCAEFKTGLRIGLLVAQNISEMDEVVDKTLTLIKEKGKEFVEKCISKGHTINKM